MWSTKGGSGEQRNKTDFPVDVAVDNVKLLRCEPNEKIPGIQFTFSRVDGDNISFLTDTILPPRQEWCLGGKVLSDNTVQTATQEYEMKQKQYAGFVKYLAVNAGVPKNKLEIEAEDFNDFVNQFCKAVMDNKTDTLLYLKTVKDKDGYTKLPKFRGKGVLAPMSDGYPVFEYTDYELKLIDSFKSEGVEDDAPDDEPVVEPSTSTDTSSFDDI
jgi:hypothetical protein